jgi:GNAT superfamily N-acetyltransferase
MSAIATGTNHSVRRLNVDDAERVIAIDRVHAERSRRRFFQKRFAAAKTHPDDFIHIGLMRDNFLRGFAFTRILRGEFGHKRIVAVLDAIGVDLEEKDRGLGKVLMEELAKVLHAMGVHSIESQADWTNHNLLGFFAASGFHLAPRFALERSVDELEDEASEET